MKRPVRKCIKCGATLRPGDIPGAGVFSCPACAAELHVSRSYGQWIGLGDVALSTAVFAAFGFHGLSLVLAVVLAHLPILALALRIMPYLIPPKIELASPSKTIVQIWRERNERTELKLNDKKRP